jgi:long-chain acyl-CoA synthetase
VRELSVPPIAVIPDNANLTDPLWRNADESPDLPLFARRHGDAWRDVTADEFRDEVVALTRGLVAAGVATGDRIGLVSRTRYEWTLFDYAIWAAGGVVVPVYETSSPDQVEWILSDSGAVACVVETAGHARVLAGLRDRLPDLKLVWQIDDGAIADLVREGESVETAAVDERRRSRVADDLATLIYTSGTTGRPKGCVLTHRNIHTDVANAIPGLPELFHEGSSTLLFLPLAHSFARLIQIGCVEGRAKLAHTADVANLFADLASFGPTFILSVPRVFEKIYNAARQKAHASGKGAIFDRAERVAVEYSRALDRGGPGVLLRLRHLVFDRLVYSRLRNALGGRCEHAVSGGAPLGARLGHFYRGIGITVYEGYGLTETSPATNVNLRDTIRIGTVGRPLPGITERIAEDGEILIKGDVVFQGYWNNLAATSEVIDEEGWFHTGDIGELDADGYLTITGRKKEMIVTAGGKNIAPATLEDRVRAHPLISQCVAVGDRRPFISALITLDQEALEEWLDQHGRPADMSVEQARHDPDLRAEIQSAVNDANQTVSRAESIRAFRILPADFTVTGGDLTPSLKVKRTVVLKEYANEIATIYS